MKKHTKLIVLSFLMDATLVVTVSTYAYSLAFQTTSLSTISMVTES